MQHLLKKSMTSLKDKVEQVEKQILLEKTGFPFKKQDLMKKTGFILFAQTKKCRNPVF